MSELMPREVHYSRPTPLEWEGLLAYSESALASCGQPQPTPAAVLDLYSEISKLDDETLEHNRYYAQGLIMCDFARLLLQPDTQEQTVDAAARAVWRNWHDERSTMHEGLRLSHVTGHSVRWPFLALAEHASNGLPRSTQLLADVLTLAEQKRSIARARPEESTELSDRHIHEIIRGEPTAEAVGLNALAGAIEVFRMVVAKLYVHNLAKQAEANGEKPPKIVKTEMWQPVVSEVLDAEELRALNLGNLGVRCAAVRLDEFSMYLDKYIDISPEGMPMFSKGSLTPASKLRPPKVHKRDTRALLHTSRLKCSAVYVRDLVPLVSSLVVDVVAKAQEYVDAQRNEEHMQRQVTLPIVTSY